jgi:hypothetical protein
MIEEIGRVRDRAVYSNGSLVIVLNRDFSEWGKILRDKL